MRRVVLVALIAGCGGGGTTVAPVIDLPPSGSQADPIPSLDEVELSVSRAGADTPLVSATFTRGEALTLDGVPFENDLVVRLVGRRAGGEIAFGRTCNFDLIAGVTPPTPHVWFTRTVRWADGLPAPHDRAGGAAWTTANGATAFALGDHAGSPVTSVDVLDVANATWTSVATVSPRTGGVVAPLGDGRAVLLGGRDGAGALATTFELVDPEAAAAARVTSVDYALLDLEDTAAATLSGGDAVVIGGRDAAGVTGRVVSLEPGDGGQVIAHELTASLTYPRSGHTLTRLSNDVGAPIVVIGGVDDTGAPIGVAELYRPLRQDVSTFTTAPMVKARSGHAAIRMPDGSVLVVGGRDASGPVDTLELFTIDGGFVQAGTLPPDAGVLDPVLTPLPDGRVLLSGGETSAGTPSSASYILRLDPLDGSIDIAPTAPLAHARDRHVTALLCDGTVLAVGGADTPSVERYQPPSVSR